MFPPSLKNKLHRQQLMLCFIFLPSNFLPRVEVKGGDCYSVVSKQIQK